MRPSFAWVLNGNVQFASGTPLTARVLGAASDVAGGVNGTLRANYNGAPVAVSDPTTALFFNTAAFSNPAFGQFGNQPTLYTALTNWAYYSEDASIIKAHNFGPDGRIHAFGGRIPTTGLLESFDPRTNATWVTRASLLTPRSGVASAGT